MVMAALSNDPLRDWPLEHYRELSQHCVERLDAVVSFIGIREQRSRISQLLRPLSPERYVNLCGTSSWAQTGHLLRSADCVVANNSGIAHLAAGLGASTVCVFGASHNPYEWMARGPHVTVLFKRTGCSPCAAGKLADCPFEKRCLTEITPDFVFSAVERAIERRLHTN